MIDFRYHLVSLASVLIALAVGIVLGAGPLKEDIGNTLTTEVTKLREEKAGLRTQLDQANAELDARDQFGAATLPLLVGDRLGGRTVTVVTLPGADSSLVSSTTDALSTAGADVVATVGVTAEWTHGTSDHRRLARRLTDALGLPGDHGRERPLDAVLGATLLDHGGSEALVGAVPQKARRTAWSRLTETGLVEGEIDPDRTSTGVVVVSGPVPDRDGTSASDRALALADLAGVLDGAGAGAVLASNDGVTGAGDAASVVTASRGDQAETGGLSTVDDAGIPMGRASVVGALEEQYRGAAGQYGVAPDAGAPFPDVLRP